MNYTSFCSNRCLYSPTRKRRFRTQGNHRIITGLNVGMAASSAIMDNGYSSHIAADYRDVLRGRTRITSAEQEDVDRQHKHVIRLSLKIFVK